jgi:hypothetical protein
VSEQLSEGSESILVAPKRNRRNDNYKRTTNENK